MTAAAAQRTPDQAATRKHWSNQVLSTCVGHADLLQIIKRREEGDTDLTLFPTAIHSVVYAKCQELIDRACKADAAGHRRDLIGQRINGELWDFLKTWRREDVSQTAPRGT